MINQKQLQNVEYFNYFGSLITDNVKCTYEIKSRAGMTKAAINKKVFFTSKLDLNLRTYLVKCFFLSTAVCGAEIWTLQKVDQKYLESFEVQRWRMMHKISCTYHVKNQELIQRVREERNNLHKTQHRKAN